MTMIEKMARAMFDCYGGYNAETREMMWQRERYTLELKAKCALQALRDPTPEMVEAGVRSLQATETWAHCREIFGKVHGAAIDAALNEDATG